jgi:hypothetical protein
VALDLRSPHANKVAVQRFLNDSRLQNAIPNQPSQRVGCRASAPLAEPKPWQPMRLPYNYNLVRDISVIRG